MRESKMSASENGKEIYLFSHIPKTGGAAVRWHFGTSLGQRFVYLGETSVPVRDLTIDGLEALGEDQKSEIEFICGHQVDPKVAKLFPGREVRFITTLRDPADTMLSQYNYRVANSLRYSDEYQHSVPYDSNGKVLLPGFKEFWRDYGLKDMITFHILSHFGNQDAVNLTGDEAVDCAISLLDDFWLVSDCSRLSQDFLPLTNALELPPIESVVNQSIKLHRMSDEIREFCGEFWALDRKLYDRITARQKSRFSSAKAS